MDSSLLRVGSLVGVALLLAAGCVGASALHLRRLRRHRSPGVAELVAQAERAAGSTEPVDVVLGELSEAMADADRAFGLATMLPRSLSRVALASGTSLGILVLLAGRGSGAPAFVGALVAFSAGMVAAGVSAIFGRAAREEARTARAKWRRDFRGAVEATGAAVEWTEGRRPR